MEVKLGFWVRSQRCSMSNCPQEVNCLIMGIIIPPIPLECLHVNQPSCGQINERWGLKLSVRQGSTPQWPPSLLHAYLTAFRPALKTLAKTIKRQVLGGHSSDSRFCFRDSIESQGRSPFRISESTEPFADLLLEKPVFSNIIGSVNAYFKMI